MLKAGLFVVASLFPLLASAGQRQLGTSQLGSETVGLAAIGLVSLIIGAQMIAKRRK